MAVDLPHQGLDLRLRVEDLYRLCIGVVAHREGPRDGGCKLAVERGRIRWLDLSKGTNQDSRLKMDEKKFFVSINSTSLH